MTQYAIHYASRELARELGDPLLGVIEADTKEEAERLAQKDGEILSRAMPCATLWAVKVQQQPEGKAR